MSCGVADTFTVEWFEKNVRLHDGLKHEDYVQGITIIPAKEKVKRTVRNAAQATAIVEEERMVYTPYAKVETRIAYFWDLIRYHNANLQDGEKPWVGVIKPIEAARIDKDPYFNLHLPAGYFRYPVTKSDGKTVEYLGCTMQVRIFEIAAQGERSATIIAPTAASKAVPLLNRWGEDPNSLMKAETGAVGRALGMAGMLVIPGSGVATAEDMQESMAQGGAGVGVDPVLPGADEAAEASAISSTQAQPNLKEQAEALITRLQSEFPEALEEVQEWARGRSLNLGELTEESPALRGVVKKLEGAVRKAEDAKGKADA
jgi:hypothetical protein